MTTKSRLVAAPERWVVGIRSDVYERRLELIWASRDDIEHFESRLGDKTLFQNLAILFLSGSAPLLVEKLIDYHGNEAMTDLAIAIVCTAAALLGILFLMLAHSRRKKLKMFKQQLFQRERKLSTTLQMVDTSSSAPERNVRGVA
jgi:hypothetical protein